MNQCTHEVRAEYWRKIIQTCGQRPAGQSAKRWMAENGIWEQSYVNVVPFTLIRSISIKTFVKTEKIKHQSDRPKGRCLFKPIYCIDGEQLETADFHLEEFDVKTADLFDENYKKLKIDYSADPGV